MERVLNFVLLWISYREGFMLCAFKDIHGSPERNPNACFLELWLLIMETLRNIILSSSAAAFPQLGFVCRQGQMSLIDFLNIELISDRCAMRLHKLVSVEIRSSPAIKKRDGIKATHVELQ